MTQAEALQEARRRWGEKASAWDFGGSGLYIVSATDHLQGGYAAGMGESFEAAFADADRRSNA